MKNSDKMRVFNSVWQWLRLHRSAAFSSNCALLFLLRRNACAHVSFILTNAYGVCSNDSFGKGFLAFLCFLSPKETVQQTPGGICIGKGPHVRT